MSNNHKKKTTNQLLPNTTTQTSIKNTRYAATPPSWNVKCHRSSLISYRSSRGIPIRTKISIREHPTVPILISHFFFLPPAVVQQFYQTEVNNEYVIRGNAAVLKCSIPSFVADFVQVVGWTDSDGNEYETSPKNIGTINVDIFLISTDELF